MAFSKAAISTAETQVKARFGVECRYNQGTSAWYKVMAGVVTPFDLRDPLDKGMRDWCRQALLQADYDERQNAAPPPAPPPSPPQSPPPAGAPPSPPSNRGFWATILSDNDVQRAVAGAAPPRSRALVSPLMDAVASVFEGGKSLAASPTRAAALARARADIAARRDAALRADPRTARRLAVADAADERASLRAAAAQKSQEAAEDAEKRAADLAQSQPGSQKANTAATRAQRLRDAATRAQSRADQAAQRAATLGSRGGVQSARLAGARAQRLGGAASVARSQAVLGMVGSGAAGFAVGRSVGASGLTSGVGSMVGMALGGPVGAVVGAALGTALEVIVLGAIKRTVGNIGRSRDLGEQAADGFSRGALSLTRNALDAGLNIGNALISGALRPFGASGSALAGFTAQVGSSVSRALMAGLGLGASGLRVAGGAAGLGVGLLGALGIGTLLGPMLGPLLGPLIGSALAVGVMKIVSAVAGVIGGVLDKLGQALGEVGRIGGAAIKTLIDVLDDLKSTALNLSKSILDLSQNSGMSIGASAAAINNLQGFNISPQQTAQMFGQNILYTQSMDRGWGIGGDPGSAKNLREFREVYQSLLQQGRGNPLIANTMASQTGKSALIPMANLPTGMFERSLANGSGLQMGQGAVLEWQQNFGLMQADLSRFAEFVKVTLGNAFLPAMQRGLGLAVGFFKENKDEIIGGIKAIGRWFYADLPGMVLQGAIFVVGAFSTITKGLANLIRGFSDGRGALNDWVYNFLGGVDRIIHGLRLMIAVGAAAAAAIVAPVGLKTVAALVAYRGAMNATSAMDTNFAGQFQQANQRQYDAQGRPIRTVFDTATDALDSASAKGDGLLKTLQGWQAKANPDALGKQYDRLFGVMEKIETNTGRTPTIEAKITVGLTPQEDFLAKVLSYETFTTWKALGQNA